MYGVAATDTAAKVRFALSESGFEDAARAALAGSPGQRSFPTTLGLFHVERRDVIGDSVWFTLPERDSLAYHGFVWSPKGKPPAPEDEDGPEVRHYTGHWYLWWEDHY